MDAVNMQKILLAAILSITTAQNVYVASPSAIRIGVDERIAIALDDTTAPQHFEIYIQDHPGRRRNISHFLETVLPTSPKLISFKIESSDVPDFLSNDILSWRHISLTVHSETFHKEVVLPLSYKAGYVFLQTDKPIYSPQQRVHFQIIPLNDEAKPSSGKIKLQIKNPRDIVVLDATFSGKIFITPEPYKFPKYPLFGTWSATVLYGHKFLQNTTVKFELQEYVLPTFTVTLNTKDIILPSDEKIPVKVEANFVYGKPVEGIVTLKLGVKSEAPNATFFATLANRKLRDGVYDTKIETNELKHDKRVGWFPELEGSKFVVEATVTDAATGQKEIATDSRGHFSSSPFVISFKRCLKDFKPGLVSIIEADVSYVDGRPAEGIKTIITASAGNVFLKIDNPISTSDENGRVLFEVHPETHHTEIAITVKTDDPKYAGSQSIAHHIQYNFRSKNKAYIAITRNNKEVPKPGNMFTETIYYEPDTMTDIYFMVISKGKILLIKKLSHGLYKMRRIEFMVTYEMVPSIRIVAFAEYKNELVSDSLRIDVAKECNPKADIKLRASFKVKEPGSNGKIIMEGSKYTVVGLLAVDSAVYALSDRYRLTKSKMFKVMEGHDSGCGPGGGLTTSSVLRGAGIVIFTKNYSPGTDVIASACEEKTRKKRSIIESKLTEYGGMLQQCCAIGLNHDSHNRACKDRAEIVKKHLAENDRNCSQAFLECCLHGYEQKTSGMKLVHKPLGRIGADVDRFEFLSPEDEQSFEEGTPVRSDFREMWLFDEINIGPDGKHEYPASLPHSITTWIIQAVSVSQTHGMCVAKPLNIESFRKVFVQLSIPYSVVKNEQIEIPATVFNYGENNLTAIVYMYGRKDLCTGAEEDEKSERKRIVVPSHSGQTVSFPVIPLMEGVFDIQVVALSPDGSDVITRKLNVVPEGDTVTKDMTINLDPSNQQRRKKRHISTDAYSDSIIDSQNLQVTAIKLRAPEGFIPGTESVVITALGDQFGPTVQTSLENPDSLIDKPRGCAEQAMIYLAPTMYTMRYLKSTNKMTADHEAKGYDFIRQGYDLILTYRKDDGSYGAWATTPQSTWLTAFIIKVFCQASHLVHIDENIMCSGVKWLINNQQQDGSFIEHHPIYHVEMMGGVNGQAPLTAFVLLTLHECNCEIPNFHVVKARAIAYLEDHLGDITESLPTAITAYALALSDSELQHAINDKLMSMAKYDEDANTLHWETGSNAYDIEATSYGLLTQLLLFKMDESNSIVNWLNTKKMASGSFKSTQDTVVALHALSEYAIRAKSPELNLTSNITSSNDINFIKTFSFSDKNALVLQEYKLDKLGGMLFVRTAGHGLGLLNVRLRYNVPYPPEKLCKFELKVNVMEVKENQHNPMEPNANNNFELLRDDQIRGIKSALDIPPEEIGFAIDPRNRPQSRIGIRDFQSAALHQRVKREDKMDNSNLVLEINICTSYLGGHNPGMTIVDAGIFTGFKPQEEELKKLVKDPEQEIERYEISNRGIVFYLKKVPIQENYCFKFRVVRDYIVGSTQSSIVKVYAYYNPDDSCTVFYSPDHNSPMLRKLCSGGVCQCAEGGCPPKFPFASTGNSREKLKLTACEDHNYVWIVHVSEPIERKDGFLIYKLRVVEVLKAGIENASLVENEVRVFLARDNCQSAALYPNKEYLVMGKDGKKYENEKGEIWHRYMLDKTSKIHSWTDVASARNSNLMRRLHWLKTQLKKGCDL